MDREQMIEQGVAAILPLFIILDQASNAFDYVLVGAVLDAILPQVTTVEELEALPDGAIVTAPWQAYRWRAVLHLLVGARDGFDHEPRDVLAKYGPLTVVWRP